MAQFVRVVPIHTVDIERTFSQLRTQNQMNEVDSLFRISVEGADVDKFPVADAVEIFGFLKI